VYLTVERRRAAQAIEEEEGRIDGGRRWRWQGRGVGGDTRVLHGGAQVLMQMKHWVLEGVGSVKQGGIAINLAYMK